MKKFTYRITDREGLHARPAGLLAKAVGDFPCSVTVEKDGKLANAKGILGLMRMAVKCGEEVTVTCSGEREAEAEVSLQQFFQQNL